MKTVLFALAATVLLIPQAFATDCYVYRAPGDSSYLGWFIATGTKSYALLNKADDAAPYLGWIMDDQVYRGDSHRVLAAVVKGNELYDADGRRLMATVKDNIVRDTAGEIRVFVKGSSCTPSMALAAYAIL
ncbi:MAG: hypothetical protein ACXVB9_15780 [Bdellovibrionota bacterium]